MTSFVRELLVFSVNQTQNNLIYMLYTGTMDYLSTLDRPNLVMIGKREVKEGDSEKLVEFGRRLAKRFPNAIFRTGNATGADRLFMRGISEIAEERLELFIPFDDHLRNRDGLTVRSLDTLDLTLEAEIVASARKNLGTAHHVDPYLSGERDRFTLKIAYILRDAWMVIGSKSDPVAKADAVFFYDDVNEPLSGGTGFTVKTARGNRIPCFNQRTWME